MAEEKHPCADGLTPECFEKYPKYAKKVFAYKLLQAICPKPLTLGLLGMLWRHLVQIPISWIPYEYFIIPEDFPTEELFPDDWEPGDELPDTIIVDPDTEFPDDWEVGDPLPDNVKIDLAKILPEVWTVGEDLPFGITIDLNFRIETAMLETLGIYIETGRTYEGVFGTGWDPTSELPEGSSWKPYVKPEKIEEGAVSPLYLGPWEPGPVHRVFPRPVTPTAPPWFLEPFDAGLGVFTAYNSGGGTAENVAGRCKLYVPVEDGYASIYYDGFTANFPAKYRLTFKLEIIAGAYLVFVEIKTGTHRLYYSFYAPTEVYFMIEGAVEYWDMASYVDTDIIWETDVNGDLGDFYRANALVKANMNLRNDAGAPYIYIKAVPLSAPNPDTTAYIDYIRVDEL